MFVTKESAFAAMAGERYKVAFDVRSGHFALTNVFVVFFLFTKPKQFFIALGVHMHPVHPLATPINYSWDKEQRLWMLVLKLLLLMR